jgi:hypothetical protein
MPFTWNAEAVPEDVRSIVGTDGERRLNPVTQTIVFATMNVGMPRITEKNADVFFARVRLWEKLMGAGTHDAHLNEILVSASDVREHIGLFTNASSMTNTQFRTRLFEHAMASYMATYATAEELSELPQEDLQ